jgi:sec-independent protein translocase protein TatA
MFNNIGTTEILIIILVLIILFGGNKISEVARGLGKATKEIKKVKGEIDETKAELKREVNKEEPKEATKKSK